MMSISKAKQVAKAPQQYSTQELDDALTAIVESDALTEQQVTNLQQKIDPELRSRLTAAPAPSPVMPGNCDHKFRVVNGRTSKVVLETESWYEAADCQTSNNQQETAVGYEPCYTLWVVDADGLATKIQTQL